MVTRVIQSQDLVAQASIQFIRAQTLNLELADARPNTKMYVFFNEQDVTSMCATGTNDIGTPLITDAAGSASIYFDLPGNTFHTGTADIVVTDASNLDYLEEVGSVFGSAKAVFHAVGTLEIFQPRETIIDQVVQIIPWRWDPLAQSFFTYGVPGGLFVSSIDLYFQTKDEELPVRVELRPMVNGYPAPIDTTNASLVSILNPDQVEISSDASVPTKFVFEPPVYLKEDADYCFVVRSNSKYYNLYTSRMGERSIEDGRMIFEQPYVGSMFKSENNITWSAEQMDDIKFTINKCEFDINAQQNSVLNFAAVVPPTAAYGNQFTTEEGSNLVTYRHNHDHGLEAGSIFKIVTHTDSLYQDAAFNGIPYTEFNGEHVVVAVPDRNTLLFATETAATSTGEIESADVITSLRVLAGGSNYQSTDTVQFSTGSATATLEVTNGAVTGVTLTNAGSGYSKAPTINITRNGGTAGTGAKLQASVSAAFSVYTNKPMTGLNAKMVISNYSTTSTNNVLKTTLGNYEGGNISTYSSGKSVEFTEFYPYMSLNQNSLIASTYNEESVMGGNKSAKIEIQMNSSNPNVSPVINLNVRPTLNAFYNRINNQPGEVIGAEDSSGSISSIAVTNGGVDFAATPVVIISPPDLSTGTQATAHAVLTGTSVTSVVVDEPGSGYTKAPDIYIVRADGQTAGTGAAAQAVMTQFNTELLATGGQAKARYITKKTSIQIVSTGIRILATLSSGKGSSVDWYVRTSLSGSGVIHDEQDWRLLSCASLRNRSSYVGEMFDYEFKLDDIPEFDTYDLKCVLTAEDPTKAPIVDTYRVIVIA